MTTFEITHQNGTWEVEGPAAHGAYPDLWAARAAVYAHVDEHRPTRVIIQADKRLISCEIFEALRGGGAA